MPRRPLVLLVEDEPLLQGLYKRLLARLPVRVTVAGEERAAIRAALQRPPDLVLLDLMIPTSTRAPREASFHAPVGYHILRALTPLRRRHRVKIIVLSNLDIDEHRQQCLALGADDVWVKVTLPPDEFLRRVQAVLAAA